VRDGLLLIKLRGMCCKMIAPVNPFGELKDKLDIMGINVKRLKQIEIKGYINSRLKNYCENLLMLNHSADEMRFYANLRDGQRLIQSGLDMTGLLNGIGAVLLAREDIEVEVVQGIKVLKNPNLDNVDKYKPLFDFAQGIYDNAVNQCEPIWGSA